MRNSFFNVKFDKKLGGVKLLSLVKDKNNMNFCKGGRYFCLLRDFGDRIKLLRLEGVKTAYDPTYFDLKEIVSSSSRTVVISESRGVEAKTEYTIKRDKLIVKTVLKNKNSYPVYYKDGDISIDMPFNDAYESSEICMKERAHTHIHTGLDVCYVRSERMGLSENNLGLVFSKGRISSYSQDGACTHNRGYFRFNLAPFYLNKNDTYELEYAFFIYKNKEDFFNKLKKFDSYLHVQCDKGLTFDFDSEVSFSVLSKNKIADASVVLDGENVAFKKGAKCIKVSLKPQRCGEHKFYFTINGTTGSATFNVISSVDDLVSKRIKFIVENQQCLDKNSPLYGDYLVYDNQEKMQHCNTTWPDYNGVRERLGMPISIIKWLQKNNDQKIRASIDLYVEFLLRESVDEINGYVYGNIGKDEKSLRLYNPPWVMLLFAEYYNLTKNVRWAKLVYTVVKYYYTKGGSKFYPNGIRFSTLFNCLKDAGLNAELKEILPLFDEHIANIVKNGTNYPPHEVNFEQTIVTPAVTLLLDKYQISGEQEYLIEAEKHLKILERFDGCQPDCRQNKIPIRFWDDFWFGKNGTFGDTLHYWSVLSGYCFYLYGKLANNDYYKDYGEQCLRNCCYLFNESGVGSCAYVYPRQINGNKGEFHNVFSNDQDFALYFLMKVFND